MPSKTSESKSKNDERDSTYVHGAQTRRKRYLKPVLRDYGDVRDATMSPSPGTFESGRGPGFKSV